MSRSELGTERAGPPDLGEAVTDLGGLRVPTARVRAISTRARLHFPYSGQVGGADSTHIYRAGAQRSRIRVDTEDFRGQRRIGKYPDGNHACKPHCVSL